MNNCLNCFGGRRQQSSGSAPVERNCLNCFRKRRQQPASAPTKEEQHTAVSTEQENNTPVPGSAPVEEEQHTAVSTEQENNTPVPGSAPTKEEVINILKDISDPTDLKEFIYIIKRLLEELESGSMSPKENKSKWTSIVKSGANFLKFVNDHTEKIEDKKEILSANKSKVIAEILGKIGELHWVVGALSIAAYLMEKCHQVSANRTEALQLLKKMVDLATIVDPLRDMISEENLKNAITKVVQGSVMCVSQIYSDNISSFFKTSVDSESLKAMSEILGHLYQDLNLVISATILKRQSEMARHQPVLRRVTKPSCPKYAVGIDNAIEQVIDLLNMTSQDESTAVVIYGFGGIGKTTLATSVLDVLELGSYNFARVYLDEERSKNDLKEKQQQILFDAFPNFNEGRKTELRDCQEGRDSLLEAFKCKKNPVFIFMDNALRSEDLEELLPGDLSDLPKNSKMLLTTRRFDVTDVIIGPTRLPFAIKPLEKEHAVKILCDDPTYHERIKDDIEMILQICGGVPLALKIVHGHLAKMGYNADKCRQMGQSERRKS